MKGIGMVILVAIVAFAVLTYKAGEYAEANADSINASVAAGERTGLPGMDVFENVQQFFVGQ